MYKRQDKYHCISINDAYIDVWWDRLILMKTYFHSLNRPEFALARWGVTLIPPQSLPICQDIVISDPHISVEGDLARLANLIQNAIQENKVIIHYGI